jgi:hypothetical protein
MLIPEVIIMGIVTLVICSKLMPSRTAGLRNIGPLIIVVPVFFVAVTMLLLFLRLHEMAYALAGLLLMGGLTFEEVAASQWISKVAFSYLSLLGFLILAIEALYKYGNKGIWNQSVPIAWLLGLGALAWSLRVRRDVRIQAD